MITSRTIARLGLVTSLLALQPLARAHAATLYTPPFWMNLDGAYGTCLLTNVGSKAITARLRGYNSGGFVAADSGDVTIQPARLASILVNIGLDGNEQIYCRFDVDAGKSKVRASGCIFNGADRLTCLEGK